MVHVRWGWQRVARAMARGTVGRAVLLAQADTWCVAHVPGEPGRVGREAREWVALDTSTIARRRAGARVALAGTGVCPRAGRAVRANIVAAAPSLVRSRGVRVGRVRRTRFRARCEDAVETLVPALPARERTRLIIVDAGLATPERCAAATDQEALRGRVRLNRTWRGAPPPPSGKRGQPTWPGPVWHPGALAPQVEPAEAFVRPGDPGDSRVRRGTTRPCAEARHTILDGLRSEDPADQRPLVVGTTARELTPEECLRASPPRWPVDTHVCVAQATTARERPRAWPELARERRMRLARLTGALVPALAAATGPLARGPWDRQPRPSAGRLAH